MVAKKSRIRANNIKDATARLNALTEDKDWISAARLNSYYNVDLSPAKIDVIVKHTYSDKIMPANAIKIDYDLKSQNAFVHRDFVDAFIEKLKLPLRPGPRRADWINPTQILNELNLQHPGSRTVARNIMIKLYNDKSFPADAFMTYMDGRGHNILLNRKYMDDFMMALYGADAQKDFVFVPMDKLHFLYKFPYTVRDVLNMLALQQMPRGAVRTKDGNLYIHQDALNQFYKYMDKYAQRIGPRSELLSVHQIKNIYNLQIGPGPIMRATKTAVAANIIPSDAIVLLSDRVYVRKKYVEQFVNGIKDIINPGVHLGVAFLEKTK